MDLDALTSSVELPAGLSASLHLQENAKRAVGGTRDKAEGEGKKDSARETKGKQKEEPTVQEKEKKAKGRAKKDSKPALPKNKVSASSGRPSVEALAQAAAHLDEKVLSSVNQSMAMELCNEPILCHPEVSFPLTRHAKYSSRGNRPGIIVSTELLNSSSNLERAGVTLVT